VLRLGEGRREDGRLLPDRGVLPGRAVLHGGREVSRD
jgi:hypothetical protein